MTPLPDKPRYAAALFDMDGLLLDTERPIFEAAQRTAATLNLGDMSAVFLGMIGMRSDQAMPALAKALEPRTSLDKFRDEWSRHMQELENEGVNTRPHVVDLLEQLSQQGTPCAVATSTVRAQAQQLLEQTGIAHYFDSVTGGDDVVNPKPDPEIYLTAARSLGADIQQCCAFEDSGPGTRAAVASKATVVQVPDMVAPDESIRALGHLIAPDILDGARQIGLID